MSCSALLDTYQNSPRLFQLADRITMPAPNEGGSAQQHIFLKNLRGSSSQFIAAATFIHRTCSQLNHVFICNDAEDAAYFHNTLENLTQALNLFYFPSSFKNRKNFRLLNSSHVMLRTEALSRFSAATGNRAGALVTYPEAVFEKVAVSSSISQNIIHIKAGDEIHPDGLFEKLVGYGFERTDFVYEPGQFAVRGGILDIYSFGNEKPYRIELFGNDVDSIRIIDPETQLSERRLLQVSIIPNMDTQVGDEEKVSLFEFLPENTIIWIQDDELLRERLLTCNEDLELYLKLLSETPRREDEQEEDKLVKKEIHPSEFISAAECFAGLARRHVVYFGHQRPGADAVEMEFNTKEQPAFNRQFDLLIEDLKSWEGKGYQLNLFADNPKQLERLFTIFRDLKEEIHFQPIATSIHEGFIDHDLKLVCYTDHQIFQRYHKYRVKQAYNKN
ncbi:MAG TPA: transcription-repair coupling factor, partial [Flavisolibacter sp.]